MLDNGEHISICLLQINPYKLCADDLEHAHFYIVGNFAKLSPIKSGPVDNVIVNGCFLSSNTRLTSYHQFFKLQITFL